MAKLPSTTDPSRAAPVMDRAPALGPAFSFPEEDSNQVTSVVAGWKGPLPPPSFVEGYGRAVADGSERVFRQFELEAEHRRQMDRDRLDLQKTQLGFIRGERRLSQWLAGVYTFGALALSAYIAHIGYPISAATIATTSIATVVAAFLTFGRQTIAVKKDENANAKTQPRVAKTSQNQAVNRLAKRRKR
ncbi:DUF2335 domain-containing protein [Methylobacterium sp. J-048]|uniref:DUF2335 domain-containing protein n=1 Tax=Methylobacterium sp. J-048 TaxID=2836635 RepID=UPI001FBBEF58|nr:DUF2335 domain-containing protein [Methylobacterium sp. J-048]MCJ2060122.1 DUF2335 domain-containing protein [Methylobacterium sp. J-048]